MKNPNLNFSFPKRIILFYCLIQLSLTLNSQTGPGIQWFREQWLDEDIVSQDESGEDWYYDFKPYFEDAIFDGYVGAGFSSIINETLPGADCANCGEGDVNSYFWETSTHQLGCSHPKIAEIDLKGEVEWYTLYGPENSTGYFRSVVQTDAGYVAIGGLSFEGDDELIYNYQVGVTGSELAGCPEIELVERKYNLLYLVETDQEGNLVEERAYGWGSPSDAVKFTSEGYEIILDADGSGYVIAGITGIDIEREDGPSGYLSRAWVIKIDEDLEIEWERTYELTIPSPLENVPWSLATCIIESGDYYFVGCTQAPEHDFDNSFIHILKIRRLDGLAYDPGDVVVDFTIDTDKDSDIVTPLSGETVAHNRAFQIILNDDDLMVHAQLRYYIKNDMNDSITYILEGDESPLAKSLLSAIAADSGDYSGAETIISEIENELTDAQGYSAALQTIGLQLLQDTLTWLEVDSEQYADIVSLSEIDSRIGIQAQHILHQINGTSYHEIIPIIEEEQEEIAKVIQKMEISELNTIDIYPNPVSKYGVIQII